MGLRRVLITSCLVVPLSGTYDPIVASETNASFRPLRPPLLGFVIERRAANNRHRLVSTRSADATPSVLLEGTLQECERLFVGRLREHLPMRRVNVPILTLGDKQFWGDVFVHAGWRIQENVFTGHYRLLDRNPRLVSRRV